LIRNVIALPARLALAAGFLAACVLTVPAAGMAADYRTPRAGEEYVTEFWGEQVIAPARNRRSVTALNLGATWFPDAPRDYEVLPFGAFFLWRNPEGGRERLRAVVAGLYNEVRYQRRPDWFGKTELVLTLDSLTVPTERQEFVEGVRIDEEELEWHRVHLGFGFSWRADLAPYHQDNALEAALTYEPGILLFSEGSDTVDGFRSPSDTYEGRVHLRLRADALERNLMELPHEGWAAGFDGWYGHRARWRDWGGGPVFGPQDGGEHRDWLAARFHALAAAGLPFGEPERHRLIASLYGGIGKDLDRFSAFRLGGEPGGGEWEALARPAVAGAIFDEFFSRSYAVANLEYRYELLFFCYLHLRGQFAWLERARSAADGTADWEMNTLPALGAAVTCGAPWNSQLELAWNYNFGLLREDGGDSEFGGHALTLAWSKEF
jgi:hypothetical protein